METKGKKENTQTKQTEERAGDLLVDLLVAASSSSAPFVDGPLVADENRRGGCVGLAAHAHVALDRPDALTADGICKKREEK